MVTLFIPYIHQISKTWETKKVKPALFPTAYLSPLTKWPCTSSLFRPVTTFSPHHSILFLAWGQGGCAKEREGTRGEGCWHIEPGHLLRRGMFLPDIRQGKRAGVRVSCILTMSECHQPLHSLSSALCLFGLLSFLEARSPAETRWQRESGRNRGGLHCLALVTWKHVLLCRITEDAVARAELCFWFIYTTAC